MTRKLQAIFEQASQLPDVEQDQLADLIQEELRSEREWARRFDASRDALARLADEAIAEHRAGRTRPLDLNGR